MNINLPITKKHDLFLRTGNLQQVKLHVNGKNGQLIDMSGTAPVLTIEGLDVSLNIGNGIAIDGTSLIFSFQPDQVKNKGAYNYKLIINGGIDIVAGRFLVGDYFSGDDRAFESDAIYEFTVFTKLLPALYEDVLPYVVYNFTVSGDILNEAFNPVLDYNGELLTLSDRTAELIIYENNIPVNELSTAAGTIIFIDNTMRWYKNISGLIAGTYTYTFSLLDLQGNLIPRIKGILTKEN